MADIGLNDILGAPNLCGIIQEVETGIPNVFPDSFYMKDRTVDGDTGQYTVYTGQRKNSKITAYGGPSQNRQQKEIGSKAVKLMHVAENIVLPVKDYMNLLNPNELSKQRLGQQEVARYIGDARQTLDNLKVSALTSLLFKGQIYFDSAGNLLPTNSGSFTTVDFAIPSGHLNQLNVFGAGNIINTAWSDVTATIDTQMVSLRQAAIRETGLPLVHAFYGKNVPRYLTNNTKLSNYFFRNGNFNPKYIETAEIPNPLLGFQWHPAYDSFYEDDTGAQQSLVGDDQVVFTPEGSLKWLGTLTGTYAVPKKFSFAGDNTQISDLEVVEGMFAYGVGLTDPVTAKIVYGDTFLPVLKNKKSIYIATVNF